MTSLQLLRLIHESSCMLEHNFISGQNTLVLLVLENEGDGTSDYIIPLEYGWKLVGEMPVLRVFLGLPCSILSHSRRLEIK